MLFVKAINPKKIVVIFAVLLGIANIYTIYNFGFFEERIVRVFSSSVFLILLLVFKGYKSGVLVLAFLCFWLADICMLRYENSLFNKLALTFPILAYSAISKHIYLKIRPIKLNKYIKTFFGFIILLNVYMIYEIVEVIELGLDNVFEKIMIYANGFSLIILGTLAGIYNLNYNSIHATYCIFFVFVFVLSAICNVLAYYLNLEILFYFNRCFYILGLTIMMLYLCLQKKEELLLE
ncbi:hypothetical protein [Hwangdonia lutea]|uniref:YhhN-like protein n=1 Tax=Hwangdonia lutea TaxID=3075823 RepID=A0AA97HNR4_9FLAO|nr:hypothetical protein [Hwangdonia sp. SCSIO 19198]WOD42301.1 hypothetical protein RNZ46_09855 [Hwangdonia sp. SCSIO 19198]